ncbi:MAG: polyketide cyclase [Mycobacteriaceae bacterium]|nr:polyketide cyclase [Mycobacteriaceae bacterium]
MNPDLDLTVHRVIRAPRESVWNAWTDPDSLARWWLPAPMSCRVERLEIRPAGAFVTAMSEDGEKFVPHLDACFLLVEAGERLVFTTAVDSAWRPAAGAPVPMTAEIALRDHADGTEYHALVRHGDRAARSRHEELGFAQGWGTVTDQLARLVESAIRA